MEKKKKNLILGIIIIVATLLICLGIYLIGKEFNKSSDTESYTSITDLSISDLKTKIENKDSFILIYIKTGCSHCEAYLPTVENVGKKYNITFYTINIANVTEDEDKTYLKNIGNISGTPTTIFITEGQEKTTSNRLVGSVQEYKLIERLKSEGYINE